MTDEQWHNPEERCFGIVLESARRGHLFILINAGGDDQPFALPEPVADVERVRSLLLTSAVTHTGDLYAPASSLSVFHIAPH